MPPTITATDHPLEKLTGDAVVVAVGKGPDGPLPPGAEAVDRLLGGRLLPAWPTSAPAAARTRSPACPPSARARSRWSPSPGSARRTPPAPTAPRRSAAPPVPPAGRWADAARWSACSPPWAGRRTPTACTPSARAPCSAPTSSPPTSPTWCRPPGAAERVHRSSSPGPPQAEDGAAPGARRGRRRRAGARPGQHPAQRPLPRRAGRPRCGRRREGRPHRRDPRRGRARRRRLRRHPRRRERLDPQAAAAPPDLLRLRRRARRSRWSARASRSTAAACRSSPR